MNQKTEPHISVIVPVFNSACFLEKCITSIINQTIYELQIILIDDGSTDESGLICDQFAKYDDRIVVIHQANAGVSAARNAGLREAKGRFIAFVDSDDVLSECAYENLLMNDKENYLSMGHVQLMTEDGILQDTTCFEQKKISQDEFLRDLFLEKEFPYLGYPWDKLFDRHIIEKYHLRFDEKIKLNEDRLFVLSYLLHCMGVIFDKNIIYYYRQRSTGAIAATRRNITVTDSEMTVLRSFREMQKICRSYSEELYFICSRKAFESALDLLNRVSKEDVSKKGIIKDFLHENSHICLQNPQYGICDRLKIIGHTMLGK